MENPLGQGLRGLPGPLLLTGHTGFKGTWMTFLLEHLNVPVVGYSLLPEKDSLYDRAERTGSIPETFADIRDYDTLERFINRHKPSTIVHMAAQPLVLKSYESPRDTFDVNVMGTVNVLDIAFKKEFVKAIIVVTTDKVYRNDNSGRVFIESDPLEGKDPYSASKVGTESVVSSWQQIAKLSGGPRVVSVRAGNVIGGGDFAENRIIPDLIRGIQTKKAVEVRNPNSTRPWQHVIEPLAGYISLLSRIDEFPHVDSLNFGPEENSLAVNHLLKIAIEIFPNLQINLKSADMAGVLSEAKTLSLDSTQALRLLGWKTQINQESAILQTLVWWKQFLFEKKAAEELCVDEIKMLLSKTY